MFDPPGSFLELDTVKLRASLGQTLQQPFLLGGVKFHSTPFLPEGLTFVICNQVLSTPLFPFVVSSISWRVAQVALPTCSLN